MAVRQIALGTVLKTDDDQDTVFETMTLVTSVTPPPRTRAEIDGKILGDTLEVPELGIEQTSKMTFEQFWEPNDTEHEKMDTLFGSKAEFDVQIVTPHATPVTDEFSCKVVNLSPAVLNSDSLYQRSVEVVRTTAITRT